MCLPDEQELIKFKPELVFRKQTSNILEAHLVNNNIPIISHINHINKKYFHKITIINLPRIITESNFY